NSVVPRRRRTRSPRQDPLPCGLRRPLPAVREEPQRGPARARRGAVGLPLVGAREPARAALASSETGTVLGSDPKTVAESLRAQLHSGVPMAVPKKKTSKARRDKRRAQHKIESPRLNVCPQCGRTKLPHLDRPTFQTCCCRVVHQLR